MAEIQICILDKTDDKAVKAVTDLFADYYAYFHSLDIDLPLVTNGETLWMQSVLPSLGRMSHLPVAIHEGAIIGFAHGSLKLLPPHLGEHKVGVVQHIYVTPAYAGRGIAGKLAAELESWFREKQVHSIELQVIRGNDNATAFWEKNGYQPELTQFRKRL